MHKANVLCMQTLPIQTFYRFLGAIYLIARNRMPYVRKMHSDLMGSAGFQCAAQMREAAVPFQNFYMRYGGLGIFINHRHFLSVLRIPADRQRNGEFIFFYIAVHHAFIRPFEGMLLDLPGKPGVRAVIFCNDQQTGCVLINPVHDSRPENAVNSTERTAAVV